MNSFPVRSIFFPYSHNKSAKLLELKNKFVYYTTADTAYQIIKNKEIWMRSTATMNDFLEVDHGIDCLAAAYKSKSGIAFRETLDAIFPALTEEVAALFDAWLPGIRDDTYIACVSEHLPQEDQTGRLSMWRAYGGQEGVALVINAETLFVESPGVNVFASPVAYWSKVEVEDEFRRISGAVAFEASYVKSLGREAAKDILFNVFRFAVLCTKHPGFSEEREWRIIAPPSMHPSPILKQFIATIRGTPQVVQRLVFQDLPNHGILDWKSRT